MSVLIYILIILLIILSLIGLVYLLSRVQMYAWLCQFNKQLMNIYKSNKEQNDERQEKK